ncbi:MAG: flagellar basal body P-ring protein FlgI [Desulfobulbaceae bacterium]|nr:flagellar basal body P-ring protein FlgI [Desulfobulbaceae bacterium]HIJ78605.1 flagellar basal body P-ring protein FlgI [Deltaproteobacteria bacterium]
MSKNAADNPKKQIRFFRLPLLAIVSLLAIWLILPPTPSRAARLKDMASIKGVRDNQLIGYGIVIGLNGTGDGNNAAFTTQGLANVLKNMGVKIDPAQIKVKNVASVMVTAKLPPFIKIGQNIDVILSSVGDASSLQGGTLLATPLKGLNNKIYAMAQGPISIGGFEVEGATGNQQKNHLTVAKIPNGASVEREVPVTFADKDTITISLDNADFTTISRMTTAINAFTGAPSAQAQDGATVAIKIPGNYQGREVAFLAALENLEIMPDQAARVVLDERTGTVVMGENVRINQLALSHGNLSLQVKSAQTRTPTTAELLESPASEEIILANKQVTTGDLGQRLVTLAPGATLGEVVRALNSVGVAPRDLIAIFQSIKASGALQAELEII